MKAFVYVGAVIFGIFLFVVFFLFRSQPQEDKFSRGVAVDRSQIDKKSISYGYKEGDEVTFIPGGFGCEYRPKFEDILRLQSFGKNVAAKDDLNKAWPLCITSGRIEPGQSFTVLEIDGEYARISTTTAEQYVKSMDSGYGKFSYWTAADWLRK